ncbi:restriction endonuclease subunit S [Rhizobium leguminosarum]|uniref:restriction endonuclease subunit S n=1 Tax=Rhizobium leguminosarum TaxID=384 RepID=UPI00102F5641|nr:restriction endonuclease subunit S [Rhizobium leguminosarum]TAY71243.1 type I restriction endonuclease subunit S [Rhizobium leguminosarum]
MSGLPKGWVETNIGDVIRPLETCDPTKDPEKHFRYVDIGSINNRTFSIESPKNLSGREAPSRARRRIRQGDVLFSTVRTYLKNIALVPGELDGEVTSTGIAVLRPSKAILSGFLFATVRSEEFIRSLSLKQDGTLYPAITDGDLLKHPITLPPLAEQKRIVAKLNALNAKSARARTELARIETLVSRYKQAVLSKAFSGELTLGEAAKANSTDAFADKAFGYPSHWRQMQLGEIADIKSGITLGKKRKPDEHLLELPYLRVANVQRGWLDLREMKTVEVTAREAEALFLREGDVLMNEGGDRDKLGRGWVWDGQISNCIHQNHVFRVRLASETIPPRFLSYYANEFGQKHFFDEGKQTTNLASISKSKLSAMQVPIPPFEEAKEIVRRIEAAFVKIDRLAAEAKRAVDLVGKLDEAILAKAFRGELVPQHEDDESAERLLVSIVQDRAKVSRGSVKGRARAPLAQSPPHSELSSTVQTAKGGPVAKSRLDEDVFEKPYLASLIKRDHISDVQALFTTSELPVADFYKQLAWEISTEHISDSADRLKAL